MSDVVDIDDKKNNGKRKAQPSVLIRLRELKCFPQVDEMARKSVYARAIAEYIQDRAGELKDIDQARLIRLIRQYKQNLEQSGVEVGNSSVQSDQDPMYELNRTRELFVIHCKRIEMEVKMEHGISKLFSNTHKEFQTATLMAVKIMEMRKMVGLLDKNTSGGVSRVFSGRVDVAHTAQDAQSRQKVLGAMELIMHDSELLQDVIDSGGITGMRNRLKEGDIPLDDSMETEGIMEVAVDGGASLEASRTNILKTKKKSKVKNKTKRKKKKNKAGDYTISSKMIEAVKARIKDSK